ncbi:MAG: hypothetical protein AB7P00_28535, partial [Sandaracinaceae bacterium]
ALTACDDGVGADAGTRTDAGRRDAAAPFDAGGERDAGRDGADATDAGTPSPCGFDGDPSALVDLSTMSDIWRSDYDFAEIYDMPGRVLSGWRTDRFVFVKSDDVVLRDFVLAPTAGTGDYYNIRTDDREAGAGLLIQNGTIATTGATDDGPLKGIVIAVSGVHVDDVEITGSHDGISIGADDALVENVCIHDLAETPTAHNDGIEIYGGSHIVIRNAIIDNDHGQTSAINITNDYGPIDDVLIEDSHLAGGGYTIYVRGDGASSPATVTNIRFHNVVIDRPGSYGVISYQDAPGAIVEWDVRDASGAAIPMP